MKPKKSKPTYSIACNTVYLLRLLWRGHRGILALLVITALCGAAMPLLGMFLPKIVVDLVGRQAPLAQAAMLLGGYALLLAVVYFARGYCENYNYFEINSLRFELSWQLFEKTLTCDYRNIESASGQAVYQKSQSVVDQGDDSGTTRMLKAMLQVLSSGIVFLLTSSILTAFSPWMVVILLAMAVIQLLAGRNAARYQHRRQDDLARMRRRQWYLIDRAKDPIGGKDIRLYGISTWFTDAWQTLTEERMLLQNAIRNRYMGAGLTNNVLNLVRDSLSFLYIILAVSSGRVTLGEAVLFFGAVTGFSGFIGSVVAGINDLISSNLQMCDLRAFFDLPDKPEPATPAALPAGGLLSIEFRDACFTYDGTEPVLDHLNLTIRPGERMALVGVNGAGKTTLVKLLCGFYELDSGSILIDGTDIRKFRRKDLLRLYSAVFQDVLVLPFSVAENVAMKPAAAIDRQRVAHCLKQAGIWDAIQAAGGIDKPMLKLQGEDGIMLSGGQQQKLLLARALYKDAPILILDEPTAALDPIAESEVYEEYQRMTAGRTSLFISHRLASTRFCDEIAFLQRGVVAELGNHEALLAAGQGYAHMFDVQSQYYRDDAQEKEAV